MDINLKDLANLLDKKEKDIITYIKQNKIPSYRIRNEYRFNRQEIIEWILKNKINLSADRLDMLMFGKKHVSITELVQRGGVKSGIRGKNIVEIINDAVGKITIPKVISKKKLIEILLAREEMMPTSVGNGIAIPHPRSPIIADIDSESISVCYLMNDFSYHAMDGIDVHTLFIILSANPNRHLEILSKISFLCQQADFINLLKARATKKTLLDYIKEKEKKWNK
jgi:PTS system nitrogen regulatory IIA component